MVGSESALREMRKWFAVPWLLIAVRSSERGLCASRVRATVTR